MKSKIFVRIAVPIMTGLTAFNCSDSPTGQSPNFLFILVDDLGWTDLGCYGSTFYETPNIDRLGSGGMKFTNAYAACQVCSPTRSAIMSGKYPARINTTTFFNDAQPENWISVFKRNVKLLPAPFIDKLPLEEITIAETLKESGYGTFFAGKWHLGPSGEYWPEAQGFDVNKGGWSIGGPEGELFPLSKTNNGYFSPYNNPRLEDGPEWEHLPDRLARETVDYIEANKNRPFLAYLSFYSVHVPLITREDLKAKYTRKAETIKHDGPEFIMERGVEIPQVQNDPVYAGMVEALDQAVGKVLDALTENGLDENTIVIFTSDNGGFRRVTSNLPLRGAKGWMYEGGIRVPMMIRWPGVTQPGGVSHIAMTSTDFYPTMLEMAGLPLRPSQHMDGKSIVPLLKGQNIESRALYWHYPHHCIGHGGVPSAAVRMDEWKLVEFFEDNHIELYNLEEDIGEQNNLAGEMPEKAKTLHTMLDDWQDEVDARMPSVNPEYQSEK